MLYLLHPIYLFILIDLLIFNLQIEFLHNSISPFHMQIIRLRRRTNIRHLDEHLQRQQSIRFIIQVQIIALHLFKQYYYYYNYYY